MNIKHSHLTFVVRYRGIEPTVYAVKGRCLSRLTNTPYTGLYLRAAGHREVLFPAYFVGSLSFE